MIAYYFEDNEEVIAESFATAGISLEDKARAAYVQELTDYLATEHNMPFKDFLDIATCQDIEEAFTGEISAKEFVDEAVAQYDSQRQGAYVTSLMRKHK